MLSSIAHVANVADWDPERILVWCDYCSVPQGHQGMQGFAINSIASYAACAAAFIVVAPDVQHRDLQEVVCNVDTYKKRLWTRVEQLCHGLANGSHAMWLATSRTECRKVVTEENWLSANLRVFEGEATDEHDKLTLVMPLLGLYAQLYATHSPSQASQYLGQLRRRMSIGSNSLEDGRTTAPNQDSSRQVLMHHPNVWRELREHKEEIFPRRIVIRPRPKPQRKASNDAVAPTTLAKPIPYGRFARRRSSSVAGIDGSLAFELFGGLVEAMEELLDDDAELHRSVVQAVERRSLSLQAAEAAHRTVAPERKEERRRSLFSAETYSRVPPRVLPPLTAHKAEAEE